MRFQVGCVWFFAAVAKMTPDWLQEGQPMGLWMAARTDLPLVGPWMAEPWVGLSMSWAGLLYDLTIPALLLWRRTTLAAFIAVLVFHLVVGVLFPIGMFPWIMIVAATLFLPPGWPSRVVKKLDAYDVRERAVVAAMPRMSPLGFALIGVYCLVQLVLPLRTFAYAGPVSWNELGMRYSWRVMTREKAADVTYRVRLADRKRDIYVSPRTYLTDHQDREMAGQPDLILQLAHHIAEEYRAKGHEEVEVRADVWASWNGRKPHRLIDGEVDLVKHQDSIMTPSWILPAPDTPPPPLHRISKK